MNDINQQQSTGENTNGYQQSLYERLQKKQGNRLEDFPSRNETPLTIMLKYFAKHIPVREKLMSKENKNKKIPKLMWSVMMTSIFQIPAKVWQLI